MKQRTIQEAVSIAVAEAGSLAQFSRDVGVSINVAWQWKEGKRPVPAVHCQRVVQVAKNKISLKEVRPNDWKRLWPDLPAPAQQEAS